MPDEVSTGELARRIERFEKRHDDERRSADERHLDAKVYIAEQRRVDERVMALVDAISAEREARIEAINDVAGAIEKFKANMKWLVAVVLIPTGLFVADRLGV